MSGFFNKSSFRFMGGFLFFLFVSISFLVGVSAYSEARGVDLVSLVLNFIKPI